MATFAVIQNNKVINIIDAPSLEVAQEATGQTCIEYTAENPAGIGYTYTDGVFTALVIEETPAE
jgi:hypothetical protein